MHNLLSTFVRKKTASCGLKASLQRIILTTENTERTIASTEKNDTLEESSETQLFGVEKLGVWH